MNNLLRFFVSLRSGPPQTSPPAGGTTLSEVDVYVILGQSNAQGRALSSELPTELQGTLSGCYVFNSSSNAFEEIVPGVNTQSFAGQFGPVVNAAYQYRQQTGKDVYFIVYAVGGTSVASPNTKGSWNVNDADSLTTKAISFIDRARLVLLSANKIPAFKGIAWWQGESDSDTQGKADLYAADQSAVFAALRGVSYLAPLPIVQYMVFSASGSYYSTVNQAKADFAATSANNAYVILSEGYHRTDPLHADAQGQMEAGQDLADLLVTL
jgi:hypothetical protein